MIDQIMDALRDRPEGDRLPYIDCPPAHEDSERWISECWGTEHQMGGPATVDDGWRHITRGGMTAQAARVSACLAEVGYWRRSLVRTGPGGADDPVVDPMRAGRMLVPGVTIYKALVTSLGPGVPVSCYMCWCYQRRCPQPLPYVPGHPELWCPPPASEELPE